VDPRARRTGSRAAPAQRGAALRTGLAVLVGLLVAATSAACVPEATSDEPDATVRAARPSPLGAHVLAGIDVSVAQARLDRERRVVQVRVANDSAVDVTVVEGRLTTPGAAGIAVSTRGRAVRSGVERDLSVGLGTPRCLGPRATAPSGTPQVELDLVDDDGRTALWRGTPDDPNGVLDRIHREDCAAVAVASGARLSLDPRVTYSYPGDGRVVGSVTLWLEPVPGGPRVEVVRVDGTTLLTPEGGAASWPVALDSAVGPGNVTLAFEPARCDPHAVAEDKRGAFLGVHARVDGVEQEVVHLSPGDTLRGEIHDYVGAACGWPQE